MNPAVNIELSVDEVNLVLEGLNTLPHGRVTGLFQKIINQATTQLNPPAVAPDMAPAPANEESAA